MGLDHQLLRIRRNDQPAAQVCQTWVDLWADNISEQDPRVIPYLPLPQPLSIGTTIVQWRKEYELAEYFEEHYKSDLSEDGFRMREMQYEELIALAHHFQGNERIRDQILKAAEQNWIKYRIFYQADW